MNQLNKDMKLNVMMLFAMVVCYISFSSWALTQLFACRNYTADMFKFYRVREDNVVISYILGGK